MKTMWALGCVALAMIATPALAQITPYAGVQLGYGNAHYDVTSTTIGTDPNGQGWVPGILGGVSLRLGPRLSLSTELEMSLSNLKGGRRTAPANSLNHFVKNPISANLGVGYRLNPKWTLQAGLGLSRASIESVELVGGTTTTLKEAATGMSWILGAEMNVGRRMFVRGRYVATTYGDVRFRTGDTGTVEASTRVYALALGTRF